jgi:hypothetical protein
MDRAFRNAVKDVLFAVRGCQTCYLIGHDKWLQFIDFLRSLAYLITTDHETNVPLL